MTRRECLIEILSNVDKLSSTEITNKFYELYPELIDEKRQSYLLKDVLKTDDEIWTQLRAELISFMTQHDKTNSFSQIKVDNKTYYSLNNLNKKEDQKINDKPMKEKLELLATKIPLLKQRNVLEEPTKMSLVAPFLQILDYDVFNIEEVDPEYRCDFGTKKGEKIDYAIMKNGEPIILIECKPINTSLDIHGSQLFRYFSVSKSKYGILTNGEIYEFYTDIEQQNLMDKKPFLKINLSNLQDDDVEQLKCFHKSFYNTEEIYNKASNLKYINELTEVIYSDLKQPSEDFIKYYTNKIYPGRNTEKVLGMFSNLIKESYKKILNQNFDNKIKSIVSEKDKIDDKKEKVENKVETTELELDCYFTLRSILRETFKDNIERLKYKDTLNYFHIFVDGPRKPLIRLYLNGKIKFITFVEKDVLGEKIPFEKVDNLYNIKDKLIEKFNNLITQ